MRRGRVGVSVVIVVVAALTVSACGRRGALEPPPSAGPAPAADAAVAPEPFVAVPAPGARAPVAQQPPQPDRPFVLDALL